MKLVDINKFLDDKPLYYKEINHKRVHRAYVKLKPHIMQPRTVHIVGTNGKGSTGKIIAHLAYKSGLSVGHYSSPHIMKLNERIWIDGGDVSNEVLNIAHKRLYCLLGEQLSNELSYFEYMTLLAFVVFENTNLMVLEAGLGGEFDATNVCDKELSVITPIGIDHQSFLGESIEEIAGTKIRSIQNKALLAPQVHDEVVEVASKIAFNVGATLVVAHNPKKVQDREGTHEGHPYGVEEILTDKGWSKYLIDNTNVALQALDMLDIKYNINDLSDLELFGRFYPLKDNVRIDVGHNPMAAKAIVKEMRDDTVLVYNSLDDKDYKRVLKILRPRLKRVEIIKIETDRKSKIKEIESVLKELEIKYRFFNDKIDDSENYLVFGSFYVVERFLEIVEDIDVSK